jgi:hypothetical protein
MSVEARAAISRAQTHPNSLILSHLALGRHGQAFSDTGFSDWYSRWKVRCFHLIQPRLRLKGFIQIVPSIA